MWERGKKEMQEEWASQANVGVEWFKLDAMLPWVSITPLGSPVVPEVYIKVARSSGLTSKLRSHCCISAGEGSAVCSRVEMGVAPSSTSSSMTMMCSSWVRPRMEAILLYWASVETTATRAPESMSKAAIWSAVRGGEMGTPTAPTTRV